MKPISLLITCATLLCAQALSAQRTISSFEEVTIAKGESYEINGVEYTDADIYYVDQNDGTHKAIRLSVTPANTLEDVLAPYLMANTGESIIIGWKSRAIDETSTVVYGSEPDKLDKTATIERAQLSRAYVWNTAKLTGLQPGKCYYYQVASNGVTWPVSRFNAVGDASETDVMRVLFVGDHQRNEHSDYEWLLRAAAKKANEKYGEAPIEDHFAFVMNCGDQVDAGTLNQYEKVHFHKSLPISQTLATMTTVGNHEYKSSSYVTDRSQINNYVSLFNAYGNLSYCGIKSGCAQYYAYQAGRVLFVALDSDDEGSSAQNEWIRKVASAAKADSSVDFVVAIQHRPLYAEQYCNDVSMWARTSAIPELAKSGKLVLDFAGHHHLYARGQMTDLPMYHIISGGGVGSYEDGYEQLWGVGLANTDNLNQPEVQKTIDQWTYQIVEFDSMTKTMTVESYSIGNRRVALDNVLVDKFSICLDTEAAPATPSISFVESVITLPYTFTQTESTSGINSVEYQIAKSADFNNPVVDNIANAEDMYGVDESFMPLDLNKESDITEFCLQKNALEKGKYYIRTRNRDFNLRWSNWSEAKEFSIESDPNAPYISLNGKFFSKGATITVEYKNAPVGTNAWIGIYADGKADASYDWAYTDGANGSKTFTINEKNHYYAVLFKDGNYDECTPRIDFIVGESCSDDNPTSITTDKRLYAVGEPIVVTFQNSPQIDRDWVGLYAQFADPINAKSYSYAYVPNTVSGSVTLNVADNYNFGQYHPGPADDGYYYVNYFIHDGYYECTPREYIIIGKPATLTIENPELTTDDESINISYSAIPEWADAHISIFSGDDAIDCSKLDVNQSQISIAIGSDWCGTYSAVITNAENDEFSPRVELVVAESSSVEQVEMHQLSVAYMNDALTICSNNEFSCIEVIDINGRRIANKSIMPTTRYSMALSLTHGIYLLRVDGVAMCKFTA